MSDKPIRLDDAEMAVRVSEPIELDDAADRLNRHGLFSEMRQPEFDSMVEWFNEERARTLETAARRVLAAKGDAYKRLAPAFAADIRALKPGQPNLADEFQASVDRTQRLFWKMRGIDIESPS